MNVSVALNDGSVIYPSYSPEHNSEVIGFYTKALWRNEIQGFKATLNSGEVIALGQGF